MLKTQTKMKKTIQTQGQNSEGLKTKKQKPRYQQSTKECMLKLQELVDNLQTRVNNQENMIFRLTEDNELLASRIIQLFEHCFPSDEMNSIFEKFDKNLVN